MTRSNTQLRVNAEVHDDDHIYEIPSFDCTPWFEQADDKDIVALAACEFGGDYPADYVAMFFEDNSNYPDIVDMFRYKREGFECHVDEQEAIAWLHVHRPHLLTQVDSKMSGEAVFAVKIEGETVT